MNEAFRLRAGKFKTPMHSAYLTTLGQTLSRVSHFHLTAPVNVYESLNAVNPSMSTGFDTGLMLHGLLSHKWDYRFGVFNGTGINVNTATKTMRVMTINGFRLCYIRCVLPICHWGMFLPIKGLQMICIIIRYCLPFPPVIM